MLTSELDHCLLRRFQVSCFVETAVGYVHTNRLLVVSCPISSCNQRLHDGLSMSTNNCMRYMDFDGMPHQQWYEWGLMPKDSPLESKHYTACSTLARKGQTQRAFNDLYEVFLSISLPRLIQSRTPSYRETLHEDVFFTPSSI